mgnify:CR=1 FL=1
MTRSSLLLGLSLLSVSLAPQASAAELQWSDKNLPAPVQTIVNGYRQMCSDIDGKLAAGYDMPMIMTGDVDGDGIQDFVFNPENMQCSAAQTTYCSNGGCQISLALSGNKYAEPIEIMGGAPFLSQSDGKAVLNVWVSNSECETTETESSCLGRFSWKDGKLDTTHLARQFQD